MIQRLAMAHPEVGFTLATSSGLGNDRPRTAQRYTAGQGEALTVRLARLTAVLGQEFGDNAIPVHAVRDGLTLSGFIGLPTLSRPTSREQYLYVNSRPVRDKLLFGAVRGAYGDLMPRDRHPMLVVFLDIPSEDVDVNVHPAKVEVRFRDAQQVRSLMVSALRQALATPGLRTATTVTAEALAAFSLPMSTPTTRLNSSTFSRRSSGGGYAFDTLSSRPPRELAEASLSWQAPLPPAGRPIADTPSVNELPAAAAAFPLGVARAQLYNTYIVAETATGVVLVDQHAAHERLVYERLKAALIDATPTGRLPSQGLLIPEVIEVGASAAQRLLGHASELDRLGLGLESFGVGAVLIREVPALLGQADVKALVCDLADQLAEHDEAPALRDRLDAVCASLACHGSVRAGRTLNAEEMNSLLRQMEAVPHSGQCSHGRPTYIELKRADIERLFDRR